MPFCFLIIDHILGNEVLVHFKTDHGVTNGGFKMEYSQKSKLFQMFKYLKGFCSNEINIGQSVGGKVP